MPVRIPQVPGLAGTRLNQPTMNPNAAAAPARALGHVAQAISDVAEPFQKIAGSVQANENAFALSSARNQLSTARNDFLIEIDKETDPAARIAATKTFLQEQKGIVNDPNLAPAVRDRLALHFDDYATGLSNQVADGAARLSQKRATMALEDELTQAEESMDLPRFEAGLDNGIEAGLILPEQRDIMRRQFDQRTQFQSVIAEIDAEPLMAQQILDDPGFREQYGALGDDEINRLQKYAAQTSNQAKGDLWNDTLNAALDGKILSEEELSEMADTGVITARERASYLNAWHGESEPAYNAELYETAFSAIQAYDRSADTNGAAAANLRSDLATLPLPKEHKKELARRLTDRISNSTSTSGKHRLTKDFQTITDEYFEQGRFGSWFSLKDHDGNPGTADREVITLEDFKKATTSKRQFLDAWDPFLANAPEDLDPTEAQLTFDKLFEKIILNAEDSPIPKPSFPTIPPAINFEGAVDSQLPPLESEIPTETSSISTDQKFGGIPIQPPGNYYANAKATVFGGPNDPIDNGLSAFGGKTGAGGKEGVAIPQKILAANFPGKDKKWLAENVRVTVSTPQGTTRSFPLADLGTAEWVWEREKRPTLDLTPGAARELGGTVGYKDGKLASVSGLDGLKFAITAGPQKVDKEASWDDFWSQWFAESRPTNSQQIATALPAMLDQFAAR